VALPPALDATLTVELDGEPVAGFPLLRRLPATAIHRINKERNGDGGYAFSEVDFDIAGGVIAVVYSANLPTAVVFNDVTPTVDTALAVQPGGLLIILDTELLGTNLSFAYAAPTAIGTVVTIDALTALQA
jgi:hypothetical protein